MKTLQELLDLRFGDIGAVPETLAGNEAIRRLAGRGVVRRFKPEPLPVAVLDTLAAVALSSPSKSDLQQRDILIVEDAAIRARINALLKDQDWIPDCPHLLVLLGNNRRQRQVHAWRGHTFANDHLDAFFNATVDAAIALEAFGRGGGPRLLPDQRDTQSRRGGERAPGSAGPCVSGGGSRRRHTGYAGVCLGEA